MCRVPARHTRQRASVLAHFDPDGIVAPHVRRTISALAEVSDRCVVVSTARLRPAELAWLSARAEVIMRPNRGYDFASYRAGIEALDLASADELIVMNDSAVFPLVSLEQLLVCWTESGCDVWGVSPGFDRGWHIQSYFVAFDRRAIGDPAFAQFWSSISRDADRSESIVSGEIELSRQLGAAGLRLGTNLELSSREPLLGPARLHHRRLEVAQRSRSPRPVVGWAMATLAGTRRGGWNPSIGLADIALKSPERLPAVKLSTLRFDPYRLDSPALLASLERVFPVEFSGVRDYLRRTDRAYRGAWEITQRKRRGPFTYRT